MRGQILFTSQFILSFLIVVSPQNISELKNRSGVYVINSHRGLAIWKVHHLQCTRIHGLKKIPWEIKSECQQVDFNHQNKITLAMVLPEYELLANIKPRDRKKKLSRKIALCQKCKNPRAIRIAPGAFLFFEQKF